LKYPSRDTEILENPVKYANLEALRCKYGADGQSTGELISLWKQLNLEQELVIIDHIERTVFET